MSVIRTVLGDIQADELGACYAHEHIFGKPPKCGFDPDFLLDDLGAAISELDGYKRAGGNSIVEMTPADYHRDVDRLKHVSKKTGVNIITTTGYIKEATCLDLVEDASVNELADLFITEIEVGIGENGIRAGVIKAGTSLELITNNENKVLRAAARAHKETGAPISTHTEAGTMGLEQIDVLQKEGVDPCHLIIGHLDRKLEWVYHSQIANKGVYLGYDQISKEKYQPDRARIDFISRLVSEGFGKQILIAGDFARRSYWPSYNSGGGPGLTYILQRFIPWLRIEGLGEDSIQDILVGNPSRAFQLAN